MATIWVFSFLLLCSARVDDALVPSAKSPVSIKVVQVADAKINVVQLQVTNTSTSTLVIDQEALKQPDFIASKSVPTEGKEFPDDQITGATHLSYDGRWTLAQLKQREPKRIITIPPGETFTTTVEITTLLNGIDKTFVQGEIEVAFTFHDFLLAIDGKETTDEVFKTRVKADQVNIHWR